MNEVYYINIYENIFQIKTFVNFDLLLWPLLGDLDHGDLLSAPSLHGLCKINMIQDS